MWLGTELMGCVSYLYSLQSLKDKVVQSSIVSVGMIRNVHISNAFDLDLHATMAKMNKPVYQTKLLTPGRIHTSIHSCPWRQIRQIKTPYDHSAR